MEGASYDRRVSVTPIRLLGDPVLRTPAAPVVDFDAELRGLVADLTETMHAAGGAGLAAPQIGVGLRVFTWFVDGEVGHLVNPDIRPVGEETEEGPALARALAEVQRVRSAKKAPEHVRVQLDPLDLA